MLLVLSETSVGGKCTTLRIELCKLIIFELFLTVFSDDHYLQILHQTSKEPLYRAHICLLVI